MKKIIEKVNEYTRISKERELTEEEKIEREKYRKLYMDKFRESMKGHLDSIKIVNVDENGSQVENTKDKDTKYN